MPSKSLLKALEYQGRVNELLIKSGMHPAKGPVLSPRGMETLRTTYEAGKSPETFVALCREDVDLLHETQLAAFRPRLAS